MKKYILIIFIVIISSRILYGEIKDYNASKSLFNPISNINNGLTLSLDKISYGFKVNNNSFSIYTHTVFSILGIFNAGVKYRYRINKENAIGIGINYYILTDFTISTIVDYLKKENKFIKNLTPKYRCGYNLFLVFDKYFINKILLSSSLLYGEFGDTSFFGMGSALIYNILKNFFILIDITYDFTDYKVISGIGILFKHKNFYIKIGISYTYIKDIITVTYIPLFDIGYNF